MKELKNIEIGFSNPEERTKIEDFLQSKGKTYLHNGSKPSLERGYIHCYGHKPYDNKYCEIIFKEDGYKIYESFDEFMSQFNLLSSPGGSAKVCEKLKTAAIKFTNPEERAAAIKLFEENGFVKNGMTGYEEGYIVKRYPSQTSNLIYTDYDIHMDKFSHTQYDSVESFLLSCGAALEQPDKGSLRTVFQSGKVAIQFNNPSEKFLIGAELVKLGIYPDGVFADDLLQGFFLRHFDKFSIHDDSNGKTVFTSWDDFVKNHNKPQSKEITLQGISIQIYKDKIEFTCPESARRIEIPWNKIEEIAAAKVPEDSLAQWMKDNRVVTESNPDNSTVEEFYYSLGLDNSKWWSNTQSKWIVGTRIPGVIFNSINELLLAWKNAKHNSIIKIPLSYKSGAVKDKDGNVTIGCKTFNAADLEKLIETYKSL